MNPLGTVALFVGLLITAPVVLAQTQSRPAASAPVPLPRAAFIATMDGEFRKMDTDHNNVITRKEVEDVQRIAIDNERKALFVALDTDHNGILTLQEFARLQLPRLKADAAAILSQADLNGDGSVTLVEWRTAKLANFDRLDTDKDGVLTVAEMKAAGLLK